MEIKASRTFKLVYCLTLMGSIFPVGLAASSGWMALVFGGGFLRAGFLLPIALLLIFGYRIVTVIRNPSALDVYAAGFFSKAVRLFSILLIWGGFASMVSLFFVKPITLAIFQKAGDGGVAFFVVGIYLIMLAGMGIIGVVMFEGVRFIGARSRANIAN
jgi:hypothetical protein